MDILMPQVKKTLARFLEGKESEDPSSAVPVIAQAVAYFLDAGGKRIRPHLAVLGWRAAGGKTPEHQIIHIGAFLELFHSFLLIHDDVMDESPTRRGKLTLHHLFTHRWGNTHGPDGADWFGDVAAITAGDMVYAWSDEILSMAGLTRNQQLHVMPHINRMRQEAIAGQFLDLWTTGHPTDDCVKAMTISRYKTAHYTIHRPLRIGAALAGGSKELHTALEDFAVPLGEALQLRDDLLDIFGDPYVTGEPASDDLEQGKHTPVVALALKRLTPTGRTELLRHVGTPDGTGRARRLIEESGAPDLVEKMITTRYRTALAALQRAPIPPTVYTELEEIADTATHRKA
ncbi:polyprenyl synthetase family protein [Streptomyces sp. NPDC057686]|uniref:polyprenyl synthetase family protein n=1 Tax=Streptomyces TaxID=1883 RepID=UPI00367EE22F